MSEQPRKTACTPTAATNKIATTLLQFAQGLQTCLSSGNEIASSDLEQYIVKAAASTTFPTAALAPDTAHRLESIGRRIWNTCLQRQYEAKENKDSEHSVDKHLDTRARLFGYLLIGRGMLGRPGANAVGPTTYLLQLGLTLSKVCLNQLDLETARLALQKVAEFLEPGAESSVDARPASSGLWVDYYTLRIALSWKDGRLDLAEHMYTKATLHTEAIGTTTSIALVQILTQIGNEIIVEGGSHITALPWFRRATAPLRPSSNGEVPQAAGEAKQLHVYERVRLAARKGLLTCLVRIASPESLEEAREVFATARAELGDNHYMAQEMLAVLQASEGDWYTLAEALCDILHASQVDVLDGQRCQDSVLQHVETMTKADVESAAIVLDELIPRLLSQPGILLDKAILLRLRIYLECIDIEAIWYCFDLLDHVWYTEYILGLEAVQEIHLMLWNIIKPLFHDSHYAQVISWCKLALHDALKAGDPSNRAKFTRKILASQVQLSDYADSLTTLSTLSTAEQDHIATRFLLFRLALQTWDHHLARSCISFFAQLEDRRRARDALYACTREAQRSGDKLCAVEALRTVAATWRGEATASTNLPSLLRCTIRLLALIAAESADGIEAVEGHGDAAYSGEIVQSFQQASEFVASSICDEEGNRLFDEEELHWFATTSYNLGVTRCTTWEPGLVVSLFTSCLVFLSASGDVSANAADEAEAETALRCHFVLASLYMAEARRRSADATTASLYDDAEKHAAAFKTRFREVAQDSNVTDESDMWRKYGILCVFEFEAVLSRTVPVSSDELFSLIKDAAACKNVDVLKAMGGCIVESTASAERHVIKRIVNEIYELEKFNSDRLAQYLRCMMQLLPRACPMALTLLEQAVHVADEARTVGSHFPPVEASWLAATAFNHVVGRSATDAGVSAGDFRRWYDGAVAMARHADDGGGLERTMVERGEMMGFKI